MTTWQIPKTNWSAVDGVSADDMNRMEANAQFASVMQYAGGTGTAITLYIGELMDGLLVTFIASNSNGGAATKINGKNLYKPYSTNTPNIIAHKAYTVWYNASGDCFFIKASAEGNAVAANVLAGTTFSNDDDTGISGAMPNNPTGIAPVKIVVWNDGSNTKLAVGIPYGAYLQGSGNPVYPEIQCVENNLVSSNIRAGTSIFGVAGKSSVVDTADATATAGQIRSGQSAYVHGNKLTGSLAVRATSAQTVTPTTSDQVKSAGIYDGAITVKGDSNLVAANIISGKSIFGVLGNATIESLGGKKWASGTGTSDYSSTLYSVGNLNFNPSIIFVYYNDPSEVNYFYVSYYFKDLPFLNTATIYSNGSPTAIGGGTGNAPITVNANSFSGRTLVSHGVPFSWIAIE